MDCCTKPRCPGGNARADMNMNPGPVIRPDVPVAPLPPGPPMTGEMIDRYPLAMAYVPWQVWQQVYPLDQAMSRGTIFPELDKPFVMGRCQ